ncbi:MAG: hypothetical protein ABI564_06690 [Ideonella sp.]
MNCSKIITLLIAPLCVLSAAVAQETGGPVPPDPAIPAPLLTRVEVLADLQIWRESGAAAIHRENEGGTDFTDPVVLAAEGRYQTMHASPGYAMLVSQIAEREGESLLIAGSR